MDEIILASASDRRRLLLNKINLPFRVQPSSADESYDSTLKPSEIAQQLALRKATAVACQAGPSLVIGADTLVVFEDAVLEKPGSHAAAREMLLSLGNSTHEVYTGVALCKVPKENTNNENTTFVERTKVTFGPLEPAHVDSYIASGRPMDKAGSYGIQDSFGAVSVKQIEGDFYNVMGFPLFSFCQNLKTFAPQYLELIEL